MPLELVGVIEAWIKTQRMALPHVEAGSVIPANMELLLFRGRVWFGGPEPGQG